MSYRLEFEPVANFLEEVFAHGAYDHKTAALTTELDAIAATALMALYGHFPQVLATMALIGKDYAAFKEVVTMVAAAGREAQYVRSVEQDPSWWRRAGLVWEATPKL